MKPDTSTKLRCVNTSLLHVKKKSGSIEEFCKP